MSDSLVKNTLSLKEAQVSLESMEIQDVKLTLLKEDYLNLRVVSLGQGISASQATIIVENLCSTVTTGCQANYIVSEVNLDAQPDENLGKRNKSTATLNVQMFQVRSSQ